ncbi:MAG: hypothetical protein UT24_C0027G0006 [Candidatus Woesebacteria bacterium GW2011_GWB1_39_12]|uniref:Uncharacterized protein n=1 Tax=Candidatus Woesebacteria bacterium GW2011_GWB1_39_12 TaxID=1618574 RepID=A0A0G0PM15_9BACT|nr:MAG: hypothetical protein UT24_C0027G0006 [Candidatus Woesebacteria bacterium GW2011_GWB1_39_12]
MNKDELVAKARGLRERVAKNVAEVSADDAALCSLCLSVASWLLFAGLGPQRLVGMMSLGSAAGAVVSGFRGKDSEKSVLRKSAIVGTVVGTITGVCWIVEKYR